MTQSWIFDAKIKVLMENEAKWAEHQDKRRERAQTIRTFEEKIAQTRYEIEMVLEEARRQGLGVEGPDINYSQSFRDTSPLYLWKVTDYAQNQSYLTLLYLITWQGNLVPSTNAQEVERDIKEWLFRIYSKKKQISLGALTGTIFLILLT